MILTPLGVTFHPVVVIGLGKNLLFKSFLAHCVPVHKSAETIQGRKLFEGKNYSRKYGR